MLEKDLHRLVCDYIRKLYPYVIFRTDFSSGMRMSIGMAKRHKALQYSNAYPDLFIAEPKGNYAGLFIELKTINNVVFKKDGSMRKNSHHEEQETMMLKLRGKGYKAEFGLGFGNTIKLINEYLNQ